MKIEFKKIPTSEKSFSYEVDSVKIEGTFCRMSPSLIKIKSQLMGTMPVECCVCGKDFAIELDESLELLVSFGPYNGKIIGEEIVFEADEEIVDFDAILASETESIKSDYHICDVCCENDDDVEFEI